MTWYYGTKKSKYNNKTTEFNGEVYHSKLEAGRAQELALLERAGDISDIRRQVKISFDICDECLRLCQSTCRLHKRGTIRHLTNYYLDFIYWDNRNKVEVYEEVKGGKAMETSEWRMKWKLLTILYERDEKKKLIVTR